MPPKKQQSLFKTRTVRVRAYTVREHTRRLPKRDPKTGRFRKSR